MSESERLSTLSESVDASVAELQRRHQPRLFVLSGPSGVGKDAMIDRLRLQLPTMHYAITATTRAPREGERDGVHYHFLDDDSFEDWIANNELIEWSWVYEHRYGIPKKSIRAGLDSDKDTFVKIDVQGAAKIREVIPDAVQIFLAPGSASELWHRLNGRGTETFEDRLLRFGKAANELPRANEFDYVVFNHDGREDEAVAEIVAIVEAERIRAVQERLSF